MLRASALATDTPVELRAVTDDSIDPLLPMGRQLRDLATALVRRDGLAEARDRLVHAAGAEAAARAATIAANFEMMNRVLDATGCPVPERAHRLAEPLGLGSGGARQLNGLSGRGRSSPST